MTPPARAAHSVAALAAAFLVSAVGAAPAVAADQTKGTVVWSSDGHDYCNAHAERCALIAHAADQASTIEDDHYRARAWGAIAVALADSGLIEDAQIVLSDAAAVAAATEDAERRVHVLLDLANAQRSAGMPELARTTLATAVEAALSIDDPARVNESLFDIATAQLAHGYLDDVAATAFAMPPETPRRDALIRDVVQALAVAAHWQAATTVADVLAGPAHATAVADIAAAQAEEGQEDQARALIDEAQGQLSDPANDDEAYARLALVDALLALGDWDAAQAIAEDIGHTTARVAALSHLAVALAHAGETEDAAVAFDAAVTHADNQDSVFSRGLDFADIALDMAAAGMLDEAMALAERVEDDHLRTYAFFDLAEAQSAEGAWDDALAIAAEIDNAEVRVRAYANIAVALAADGMRNEAADALAAAEAVLPDIGDPMPFANANADIAVALAALHNWAEATSRAAQVENEPSQNYAYLMIVRAQIEAGLTHEAWATATGIYDPQVADLVMADVIAAFAGNAMEMP